MKRKEIFVILLFIFTVAVYADLKRDIFPAGDIKKQKEILDESDVDHTGLATLAWNLAGHTGTASNFAGFSGAGAATFYPESDYVLVDGTRAFTGVVTIEGVGTGGYTAYDLKVGDTDGSPTYGMIQIGNASIGRTSHTDGIDLDGAVLFRNIAGPVTSEIEFIFVESTATTCRFALPKSGVGNATYNPRSMLIAGPAPADTDFVKVSYWQGQGIFDNLACDTASDGADLGVQNDLEVEGDIFVDSIKESTTDAGATIESVLLKDGNITGTDVDISAGTGDYSSTGTIASGKHTITGTGTAPLFEVKNTANNCRVIINRDDAAALGFNVGATKVGPVFDSDVGNTYAISSQTLANILAGTGGTTRWSINSSGDVIGTGTLTGHTSITVDNINLNGNTITGSGPPGLHITAAAPITIGAAGTNVVSINHSTGAMIFTGTASLPYGTMFAFQSAIVVTVSSANEWEEVTAGLSGGSESLTVFQNNHEIRVVNGGHYLISWTMSAQTTAANQEIMAGVTINSADNNTAIGASSTCIQQSANHATIVAGNKSVSLSGSVHCDLAASDVVSLCVLNETASSNITVEHVTFTINMVGGT